eukprot:scaffold19403_cov66-Phaeocystis_antarctica.AAC.4
MPSRVCLADRFDEEPSGGLWVGRETARHGVAQPQPPHARLALGAEPTAGITKVVQLRAVVAAAQHEQAVLRHAQGRVVHRPLQPARQVQHGPLWERAHPQTTRREPGGRACNAVRAARRVPGQVEDEDLCASFMARAAANDQPFVAHDSRGCA